MKNPAAIFDGLHGKNIILICSVCGERHYPRCKAPEAVSLGSKGGKARAKKYTKEQLSAMGKKGGRPRTKKSSPLNKEI